MTQELLFSKYAEQYPLTVPQEAIENELQLLILEEKQRMQYEMLTGSAMHLAPQEELNGKLEALQAEAPMRSASTMSESVSFTCAASFTQAISNSGADLSAEQQWMVPRPNIRSHSERRSVTSIMRYRRTSSSCVFSMPVWMSSFSFVSVYFVKVHGRPNAMRFRSLQTMPPLSAFSIAKAPFWCYCTKPVRQNQPKQKICVGHFVCRPRKQRVSIGVFRNQLPKETGGQPALWFL